jgi:hypothetical protein
MDLAADTRSLAQVDFGQDPEKTESERQHYNNQVHAILARQTTLATAEDLKWAGCTGLFKALHLTGNQAPREAVASAIEVRASMTGARFGLTCYCPPTLFCFVHNAIGGLQEKQACRHPDALKFTARELTPEERETAERYRAQARLSRDDALRILHDTPERRLSDDEPEARATGATDATAQPGFQASPDDLGPPTDFGAGPACTDASVRPLVQLTIDAQLLPQDGLIEIVILARGR